MTSKIVVNNIEADAGVSTVTFNSNVERGISNLHSTGLNVSDTFLHSTGLNVGTGATIHQPADNVMTLGTNGSERLRIDSSGNVGINEDGPAAYGKFVVNGTGNVISLRASSGAASLGFFEAGTGRFYIKTLNGSDGLSFVDGDNSSERLRITSDGQLKLAGLTLSQRNSATGVNGGLIYNSDGKILQYYDGSGWISLNTTNQIVATGGNTVTTGTGAAAGYRIHDFQSNGTFEITSGFGEVEVLVVAGGGSEGGGGAGCHGGGGGGGGGVVYQKLNLSAGKYTVTIGAGGLYRNNGGNSVFGAGTDNTITALGGGAGGPTLTGNGNDGGSGGGGSRHTTTNQGGAATQPSSTDGGFGNAGGNTGSNTNPGGGGGAGGAGNSGSAGSNPGRGGAGKQFLQFGVSIYFGAGGNGNGGGSNTGPEGQTGTSSNGAGNTGAGGGGSPGEGTRYYGGSGRVMIRYPAAS